MELYLYREYIAYALIAAIIVAIVALMFHARWNSHRQRHKRLSGSKNDALRKVFQNRPVE